MKLGKNVRIKLQKAALTATGLIFGIMMTATPILWDNESTITGALNQQSTIIQRDQNVDYTAEDLEYYKSDFKSIKELVYNGFRVQEKEQAEGTVLLKNDNDALPLAKGSKVSVFGVTGAVPFYGASGSGGINTSEAVGWYDAFRGMAHSDPDNPKELVQGEELMELNESLVANYEAWTDGEQGSGWGASFNPDYPEYYPSSSVSSVNIGDVPWDVVEESSGYDSIATYGDAAIYIIKRTGGEGYDLPATSGRNSQYGNQNNQYVSENDGTYGDYLQLSPTEISVLEGLQELKEAGTIDKIVLILNMASTIQLNFLAEDTYDIDACLWTGSVGEVGTVAVAKLLTGEYNFSGGASSTLWADNLLNPVNNNFMDQNYFFTYSDAYDGAHYYNEANVALTSQYQSSFTTYTVYQEGMYLGYRYTETRYYDYVTQYNDKVGDFNYDEVVAYPFGYGLSYTTFEFSDFDATDEGDHYNVSVTVTNTGDYAGKVPVQIYVAKPYTDDAVERGLQVPAVELVQFGKTAELKPAGQEGDSQTVTIEVDKSLFASYDANMAKTYITLDGDYYLIAAQSAHEAVNNLLAAQGNTPENTDGRMDAAGNADLTKRFSFNFDDRTYSVTDGENAYPITNRFDFADINKYEGRGDNSVEYYSREDWASVPMLERKADGTLVKHNAELSMTQQMVQDMRDQMDAGKVIVEDDVAYPTYDAENGLVLLDLMNEDGTVRGYDDPLWDDLLDQLSWDDTVELLSNGRHKTVAIGSVGKPSTGDENGPNGFNQRYSVAANGSAYSGPTNPYAERVGGFDGDKTDENGNPIYIPDPDIANGYTTTGFSSNGVLAASFNKEIAEEVGEQIGEEGLWAGQAGLLGIGLNIIRSPYAGRAAEYYSECGTLSGLIAVPEIAAIESNGVHCFIKHAAMNEGETARHGVNTWATEQAMRELYFRPFEMGIVDGGSFAVMTSFSRMGTTAVANCVEFTQWLRNECELPGIVETDCAGDMTDGSHGEAYVSRIVNVYTGASDLNEYNYGDDTPDYTGSSYTYADFAPDNANGGSVNASGNYGKLGQAMREASKRILYHTLTSNAMNSYSSDTIIINITPTWEKIVIAVDVISGVLLAAAAGWFVTTTVLDILRARKEKSMQKTV